MSKLIKICHLTSAHPHLDVRIFEKECTSLVKAGFEVKLIVAKGEETQVNGVHIIKVKSPKGSRFKRMWMTAKLVYKRGLKEDAEIYHFHDPELLRFALRLKRKGKKVIYDAHEDLPRQILTKYWIPSPFRKVIAGLVERYENYVSSRLDAIIAATPTIGMRFKEVNNNTIVINNFPVIYPSKAPLKKEGEKYLCYVGGISEIRGVRGQVDAMEYLPNIKLKMAGKFSPISIKNELEKSSGWRSVEYLDYLNRDEVRELLTNSIAGLVLFHPLPNHLDALPNKMFEYMSEGVPVIASNFPSWKSIIVDNECGVCVNPESPEEIANAAKMFENDPALSKKMGEKGRKMVQEKYNWSIEEKKLLSLYSELLAV
ncbi:MAG: glycosyltransferase involved in cell wall biosynthesis [Saprospiraceae bacterium]|jgi:glycosyltransferase involved in cell wall biosynthesis